MSVNRDRPHVFVLPEDDANRQLSNGFHLELDLTRQMQVLLPAGGWTQVLKRFLSDHVPEMDRNQHRYMVLLIDFDARPNRLDEARAEIPNHLTDRVFVLGVRTKPEALRTNLGRPTNKSVGRWQRIAAKELIRPGGTISFGTMHVRLTVCDNTFSRSCSSLS